MKALAFALGLFVWGAGCAALRDADAVNNPNDDATMYRCRLYEKVDWKMSHDAGGAWDNYNTCMVDAGYR